MQVVSLAPVPVASLSWRIGDEPWVLTVITKLTFRLEPGTAKIAKLHDPVHEEDQEEGGAVFAPSDLVPSRPLVDVMVVGDAYAPRNKSGSQLTARIELPGVDKRVIIDTKDGDEVVPLTRALGPIPASAPERSKLLAGAAAPTGRSKSVVLPTDFDLKFFNAAPADQQLVELRPNTRLRLEQLHPDYAVLETRLPDMAPQVFVERSGSAGRAEQSTAISALWIDTRRSVATVTWHSQVALKELDEPGKVFVALAGASRRLDPTRLGKLIGSLGGKKLDIAASPDDEPTVDDDPDRHATVRAKRRPPPLVQVTEGTLTTILERHDLEPLEPTERTGERTADPVPMPGDGSPAWIHSRPAPSTNAPMSAVPPSMPHSQMRPPLPTAPGIGPHAFIPRPPQPVQPARDAELDDTSSLPKLTQAAPARQQLSQVVQLLWFDETAGERMRRRWPELSDTLDFSPRDPRHDLPGRDRARARDHHLHFGVLTEAPTVTPSELRDELKRATSDSGRSTPPLIALAGELTFPFEELAILHATAAALRPVAGDDKKLLEALGQVKELADTPLLSGSAETVSNFTRRLRKLYGESKRSLSLEYLDEAVQRILLEERRYQKRTLFGDDWIRALFTLANGTETTVAYLPARLDKQLPMLVGFHARIVAELHVRQDQYEPHPCALRVVTLGRVVRFGE